MEQISNALGRLPSVTPNSLNEISPLSATYAARVAEIIVKSRIGVQQQLTDAEMKLSVAAWLEVLQGHIPEARLNDCYLHASRNRNTTFPLTQFELCDAWNLIRAAERSLPPIGTHDWDRARKVCVTCHDTGTELFVKRDEVLGRDYTYGKSCTRCG